MLKTGFEVKVRPPITSDEDGDIVLDITAPVRKDTNGVLLFLSKDRALELAGDLIKQARTC